MTRRLERSLCDPRIARCTSTGLESTTRTSEGTGVLPRFRLVFPALRAPTVGNRGACFGSAPNKAAARISFTRRWTGDDVQRAGLGTPQTSGKNTMAWCAPLIAPLPDASKRRIWRYSTTSAASRGKGTDTLHTSAQPWSVNGASRPFSLLPAETALLLQRLLSRWHPRTAASARRVRKRSGLSVASRGNCSLDCSSLLFDESSLLLRSTSWSAASSHHSSLLRPQFSLEVFRKNLSDPQANLLIHKRPVQKQRSRESRSQLEGSQLGAFEL